MITLRQLEDQERKAQEAAQAAAEAAERRRQEIKEASLEQARQELVKLLAASEDLDPSELDAALTLVRPYFVFDEADESAQLHSAVAIIKLEGHLPIQANWRPKERLSRWAVGQEDWPSYTLAAALVTAASEYQRQQQAAQERAAQQQQQAQQEHEKEDLVRELAEFLARDETMLRLFQLAACITAEREIAEAGMDAALQEAERARARAKAAWQETLAAQREAEEARWEAWEASQKCRK